ncbi:MAG: hypothetical protein WBE74_02750 [Terracidiphilus sp.]
MENAQIAVDSSPVNSLKGDSELSPMGYACLRELAGRYIWWKTSDQAMRYPARVAAQVMNLGTWEDLTAMAEAVGDDYLRGVLRNAEAGQIDARSWHYWHYRLGLAEFGVRPVPPMPARTLA